MRALTRTALFCAMATGFAPAVAADQAIIVLDGSGSMWGQIDGTAKISIARNVLGDVLSSVPPDLSLGLMAYGHREKGNCSDIELIIAPAPGAAAEIVGTAGDISPKGKTPLSDAVLRAAEALKYGEEKATVILITDGLETCEADPCALARQLESNGIDFTAHVVGFGLSPDEGQQVACIAEETGGKYIQADNADALGDALVETVAEVVEPPPPPVEEEEPVDVAELPTARLDAPDSIEIGQSLTIGWEGPGERFDYIVLVDPEGNNGEGRDVRTKRIIHSDLDEKQVRFTAPVSPRSYEIQYRFDRDKVIAARPIEVTEAQVSLMAPPNAGIGTTVAVEWIGPGGQRDTIQLYDPSAREGSGLVLREKRLVHGDYENRSVSLILPTDPGFYQLRYWNRDDDTVLASREIEVLETPVSLSAPDTVDMGRRFEVQWTGPGARRDSVELFDPELANGEGKVVASIRLTNGDFEDRTVTLLAPTAPGDYQLRYWNGDDRAVLATAPITVIETAVEVSGPQSTDMGRTFEASWVGPGATRDAIELFDPDGNNGKGRVVSSIRVGNGDFEARTVNLVAPNEPGDYQLRYWDGHGRKVLAVAPIVVVETTVTVAGPESADMGREFEVSWVGPGGNRDAIELFDPDGNNSKGKVLVSKRLIHGDIDSRVVRLLAPNEPGDYELRYWDGRGRKVLATAPIAILATEVSVSGPDTVEMGRSFPVDWIGPGGNRDAVEVFDPDGNNGKGRVVSSRRLVHGDYDNQSVELIAPIEAKTYDLRYWDGVGRSVLAVVPVTIVATDVTISAPDSVPAGEAFAVEWVGPGASRDSIDVMSGDPLAGKRVGSARLTSGDYDGQTVMLKAPKEPGSYALRYWNGDFKEMLATRPIVVE